MTFRYVLWDFTALVLGVQTIYGSFFLSMLGMRRGEGADRRDMIAGSSAAGLCKTGTMTPETDHPANPGPGRARWALTLVGLALFVFAVVALTAPGRIDIEDGQTRFEAGRSLIEHGDTAIRDPRLVWFRFRDGAAWTSRTTGSPRN